MSRDDATLHDLVLAAEHIGSFIGGMQEAAFLTDVKTQSAVMFQVLVLGEAVKRLSQSFRDAHPAIPWPLIARMRDKLIHHYDAVDWREVWKTAAQDVPALLAQLQPLLPPAGS